MLQRRPTDEEIQSCYAYKCKLSQLPVKIFKGHQLYETKPNFLGDYRHVSFFDETVKDKIDRNKYYKCWYTYRDAHDPQDSSEWYSFAYVEEVPQEIVDAIEAQDKIKEYLSDK